MPEHKDKYKDAYYYICVLDEWYDPSPPPQQNTFQMRHSEIQSDSNFEPKMPFLHLPCTSCQSRFLLATFRLNVNST